MSGQHAVGHGMATWSGAPLEGIVREVNSPKDVIGLLSGDASEAIILMHTAGATTLSPLFSDIAGIVCTTGSEGSHVAILSRDFGIPCIVGANLTDAGLNGSRVRMDPSGEIFRLDD
jgi:phosphoenolpyruvate-protein kinase (PTS system EI component)